MKTPCEFSNSAFLPGPKYITLALLLFLTFEAGLSFAGDRLPAEDYERLITYVNNTEIEKFVLDPAVGPKLEIIAGAAFRQVLENIEVHGPIGIDSNILFVSGSARHKGLSEAGFVGIDLYCGHVYAALYSEGTIHVYGKMPKFDHYPKCVRNWVLATWAWMALGGRMPPNVNFHVPD
jgi:hypothetical protein